MTPLFYLTHFHRITRPLPAFVNVTVGGRAPGARRGRAPEQNVVFWLCTFCGKGRTQNQGAVCRIELTIHTSQISGLPNGYLLATTS
eukprot:6173185-Prymnesium_polylepis.2